MKRLTKTLALLSLVGMVLPQAQIASAAQAVSLPSVEEARVSVADVALTADGLLEGQLLDENGVPRARTQIAALSGGKTAAAVTTDAEGRFALPISKAGVYVLSDGRTATTVRAWTAAAAPPPARPGILFISGSDIQRAAVAGQGLYRIVGAAAIIGVTTAVVVTAMEDDDAS